MPTVQEAILGRPPRRLPRSPSEPPRWRNLFHGRELGVGRRVRFVSMREGSYPVDYRVTAVCDGRLHRWSRSPGAVVQRTYLDRLELRPEGDDDDAHVRGTRIMSASYLEQNVKWELLL